MDDSQGDGCSEGGPLPLTIVVVRIVIVDESNSDHSHNGPWKDLYCPTSSMIKACWACPLCELKFASQILAVRSRPNAVSRR